MPRPAFFIVWGTKVRNNHLGFCADFCAGCLQMTTNELHTIESASHVYYIHGAFTEQARYLECMACGFRRNCDTSLEAQTQQHSLALLMERARPPFSREDLRRLAHDVSSQLSQEARDKRRMACFCESQTQKLDKHNESNLMWIVAYIMAASVVGIIFYASENDIGAAITAGVGSVGLTGLLYWRLVQNAGKVVMPAWQRFEKGCGISLPQVQQFLDEQKKYARLRGILRQSRFDSHRFETGSRQRDRDIVIDIVEFT